jgi:hypothetical protein
VNKQEAPAGEGRYGSLAGAFFCSASSQTDYLNLKKRMMTMNSKPMTMILAFLLLLAGLVGVPTGTLAASKELSATAKKALDATAAQASEAVSERIRSLYSSFLSLQKEELQLDQRIKSIHDNNTIKETELRRKIREIDASRLQSLALQVQQTKQRYQPLFDQYTSLNKQISAARAFKSKELSYLLGLQAKTMKILVDAARLDIRKKEDELRNAKASANQRIQTLRDALDGLEAPKSSIKSLKQSITAAGKQTTAKWSDLNKEVRANDASAVEASLSSLVYLSRQNMHNKQSILIEEEKMASMLRSVERRLP